MDAALEALCTFISYRVWEGFESEAEIAENATQYALETQEWHEAAAEVARLTASALAAHRAEQAGWPTPTDCDRLDEAFAALNRQGIVARQDFSCCNNCGHIDIWDEIALVKERQPVNGYVFYHFQFTERAIESGQLLLAYGCEEDSEEALVDVAHKVVAELRRVGLDARWQGAGHPVVVDGIQWRRRR